MQPDQYRPPAGEQLPLHDLVVLDATEGLAGPVATRLLVDAGARVIKIESSAGDWTRRCLPAAFATWNRGKDGLRLDLEDRDQRRQLDELLQRADVFVHSWPQQQARRHGLDDASLRRRYPRLVAASVTGYPENYRDTGRPDHEILVQARLGAMDEQQGLRPGPNFVRMPFASWTAAFFLACGIVTRLIERWDTGAACAIHTSILQGALAPAALYWQRAERPPEWMARHALRRDDHPSNLTIFRCKDDRWIHALGGFAASEVLRDVLGAAAADLFGKPVTLDNQQRWAAIFATRTVEEWLEMFWSAGVIAMPVLEVGEVLTTEQARANGYALAVEDDEFGSTIQAGSPISFEGALPASAAGAPWKRREISSLPVPRPAAEPGQPGGEDADPLSRYRVLDFGAYVAGPYGAQCAADFGADVIKVEPPWGERGRTINQFTGCQRAKRSLAVDLQRPEAAEVLRRLLESADIVMHNVREPAAGRLGIDDSSVHAVNPTLVYAQSSAWGIKGSWAAFAAFDPAACAVSGWTSALTAPGDRPMWLRNSTMDTDTGLSLYLAAILGLFQRLRTGRGTTVRTSMLGVATLSGSEVLYRTGGQGLTPFIPVDRDQTGLSPYYRMYELADGRIAVAATTDTEQKAFREAVGAAEPRLADALRRKPVASAMSLLEAAGVPAEVVALENRDAFFDRELADHSGLIARYETRDYGWFEQPAGFWCDSEKVIVNEQPIPGIGEHTAQILAELGFSEDEIAALIAARVVSTERIDPPAGRKFNVITKSLATYPD
jgi:crotonobetainyl-CoA:carnitine CoA-transferase CaiB-like acyl-CoA transferase